MTIARGNIVELTADIHQPNGGMLVMRKGRVGTVQASTDTKTLAEFGNLIMSINNEFLIDHGDGNASYVAP